MAVLKSKDFPQIRQLVKLCGKFVVVKERHPSTSHTKKEGSRPAGGLLTPASQARDSTRPRGARARRARRRRGLGPVWRNSTRGAARASQHTRSRPAPSRSTSRSTPGSLRVGRARGAAEGSQQAASPHKCMMTDARSEGGRRRMDISPRSRMARILHLDS